MSQRPTRILMLGGGFGEIAPVSDRPRTAAVRAVSPSNVLAVDRAAFPARFAMRPPLTSFFESLIATRSR